MRKGLLPPRKGLPPPPLREAESLWLTHQFPGVNARRKWIALEWKAFRLRNKLLFAFRWAYRRIPDLLVPLSDIIDCRWHANPIQDLHDLVNLGRQNEHPLEAIHYDMAKLDQALAIAREPSIFLSAGEHDIRFDPVKRIRDHAYTYLTVFGLKMKTEPTNSTPQFAVCIHTDDPDLLTPRKIYQVLPDESAAKSNYIRVIDNEGEDYLYPGSYFVFIELPQETERALLHAPS